ncbi:DoxX family membrane protein [Actinomyces massiliensis]|uniref:DoxX family membrane protein n=1 Tax=Actinomyces massiliensis TaxID=461393 RepID=UPI0028EA514C|nr:DoxX family membrane protein [Actinomyces massiliensis]
MIGPANVLARGLLAGVFVVGGINQIKGAHLLADKVEAAKEEYGVVLDAAGEDLVRLNGAGMALAGGALALGIAPRLSAAALIGLLVPTTIVGHPFWKIEDKAKRRTAVTGTLNNAAIIGGLMLVRARRKR